MGQFDANVTKEQLAQMEREFARKREAAALRRAKELARLSDERVFTDTRATTWTYIVVDGSFARVCGCETERETLGIPDKLDGFPVREIDAEALSGLVSPREVVCAGGIDAIGPYAFRRCPNLRRLVLPAGASDFSPSWIASCPSMEELVLPGGLREISADVLACPTLRILEIGAGTLAVKPGAFGKSQIEAIRIDSRNEALATDGVCIYTSDGAELVAMASRVAEYAIVPGCRRIGEKAFAGAAELKRVHVPESVVEIGPLAFARSGITSFECPHAVAEIGEKAFLQCPSLREVRLGEGLRLLGDEAFAGSSLETLRIPASVVHLGRSVAERTNVRHSGADATFRIDARNGAYFVDEHGCLYARRGEEVHLVQMLEAHVSEYSVRAGTAAIEEKAFAYHEAIESVRLPEGLRFIGDGAFRFCRKLREANLPSTVESIGANAFFDTAIESIDIPDALRDIGSRAFITDGAHHEGPPPSLRSIRVAEGNPRFFMHDGMLCRRMASGVSVVVFTSSCARVEFPEAVVSVEDYAFNNAFGIEELFLDANLHSIGACGLSVECAIKTVRIDVSEPVEGRSTFLLRFPNTPRSVHGFLLALGAFGQLYLPDIMAQYDNCIASARDYYSSAEGDNASAYEQVKLITGRLQDSVLLTAANRKRYLTLISQHIEEICVDIARHDDREALGALADLGLLNAENVNAVIDAVNCLHDASTTGYLLELKRLRFGYGAADYGI